MRRQLAQSTAIHEGIPNIIFLLSHRVAVFIVRQVGLGMQRSRRGSQWSRG